MQLVVMAVALALVRAGQGCSFGCHPTNVSILVEGCGLTELVYTTVCAGQCYHEDPVYMGSDDWAEQKVCNGDWTYEVKHIKGCPEAVSYPMARNCQCTACNSGSTYCGRFPGDVPNMGGLMTLSLSVLDGLF
uniref:Glycoprotein hormone subunit beta domain-containing protein n=1 Tax=Mola mola TaxID=94237 RepID=A0A3Q3VPS6_MOLML